MFENSNKSLLYNICKNKTSWNITSTFNSNNGIRLNNRFALECNF